MQTVDFLEYLGEILEPAGSVIEDGEVYAKPELEVLAYFKREVRLNRLPWLGSGLSVVAVIRQLNLDLKDSAGLGDLLRSATGAIQTRYPPWQMRHGPSLGVTLILTASEPIAPGEDESLDAALSRLRRDRAVVMGLFRVNPDQEAFSFALRPGPQGLFPEPTRLAEAFSSRLRRHLRPIEFS